MHQGSDIKVEFLTESKLLGPKKILYTCLDHDMNIQNKVNEQTGEPIDRFKKTMPRKLTLCLEMVGVMVKISNVNMSELMFPLNEQSMH